MRACGRCGLPAVAGADRCLACGGALVNRRRLASPFGGTAVRRGMARWASVVSSVLAIASAAAVAWLGTPRPHAAPGFAPAVFPSVPLPTPHLTLSATRAPPRRQIVHLQHQDVQESCLGRPLPGDLEVAGAPPAVIDGNPLTSWHCDGDGARLRPRQFLAVFFPRTLTLTRVGISGYDQFRPCRFVTVMELAIGAVGYRIRLPASPYPQLRWLAVPPTGASQLKLAVLQTKVPPGRYGPNCARTAIAEVGFAARS